MISRKFKQILPAAHSFLKGHFKTTPRQVTSGTSSSARVLRFLGLLCFLFVFTHFITKGSPSTSTAADSFRSALRNGLMPTRCRTDLRASCRVFKSGNGLCHTCDVLQITAGWCCKASQETNNPTGLPWEGRASVWSTRSFHDALLMR